MPAKALILGTLVAAAGLAGCGDAHRPAAAPPKPTAVAPRASGGPGALSGVHFAVAPIVVLSRCHGSARKCGFRVFYTAYARLDRSPRARGHEVVGAEFALGDATPIDPIRHVRRTQRCFQQSFGSDDPRADGLEAATGQPVRLRFRALDRDDRVVGEIAKTVELVRPEPRGGPDDYSPLAEPRRVGC